jgi:hypothetical protein
MVKLYCSTDITMLYHIAMQYYCGVCYTTILLLQFYTYCYAKVVIRPWFHSALYQLVFARAALWTLWWIV